VNERLEQLRAGWERTTVLIRAAVEQMPPTKEVEAWIEECLSHNELGDAFDALLYGLVESKTKLMPMNVERLQAISDSMDYHPADLDKVMRIAEQKESP
jgi:hypothetical protein